MTEVVEFIFPRIDVAMDSGKILEWRKKEGDDIKRGEVVVVVETEKAAVEIPSEVDGKLLKILRKEGEEVKVGEVIAEMQKR
ncbi:MAG: biotin/lipoyl-binding protein [Candidatus Caldarchaeum sp.]|nr:biotin/lipoyl-binding protein [Candidatus Caldarchaeum sp.]MCS7133744.1 biotin/lipoyl-binding protein [Candidatus Caldarchaeum sp.]MCX8201664.1 biotin/lipoyl-binding protein [Candidatus Caldarchaeum sp.]MDW8434967.1 biotin/lipoyl-containing protein [Candidatus Caldarchaeum sp.]